MIAKRNEFVKKTAGRRADGRGARGSGGKGEGDMEILVLKRVWKNFGGGRGDEENFNFT